MHKKLYRWAPIGILSVIGWGVDVIPGNTSWIPSIILWGIAGIWCIANLIYFIKHRHEREHDNEERVVNLIEEIKQSLVTLNAYERDAATLRAKMPCSRDTAIQIHDDFVEIFGDNVVNPIRSVLQEIVHKNSVDPLIAFFKKSGDILDSNKYGLKMALEEDDLYKSSRTDLSQSRVRLKMSNKKKRTTQKNIDRVRSLSYGLNSSVILRSVFVKNHEH